MKIKKAVKAFGLIYLVVLIYMVLQVSLVRSMVNFSELDQAKVGIIALLQLMSSWASLVTVGLPVALIFLGLDKLLKLRLTEFGK